MSDTLLLLPFHILKTVCCVCVKFQRSQQVPEVHAPSVFTPHSPRSLFSPPHSPSSSFVFGQQCQSLQIYTSTLNVSCMCTSAKLTAAWDLWHCCSDYVIAIGTAPKLQNLVLRGLPVLRSVSPTIF